MKAWNTVLIGFGKIAAGYAQDHHQRQWFRYSTHAQVLRSHPAFHWSSIVDPCAVARERARQEWGVANTYAAVTEIPVPGDVEIAVIATAPSAREGVLDHLPNLRAILIEKPLADNLGTARQFVAKCEKRGILLAVNLLRRYDRDLRELSRHGLALKFGAPMAVFGTYGNGLRNNGTHLVDLIRMLVGETITVTLPKGFQAFVEGPISPDINVPFCLGLAQGRVAMIQPLKYECYRELGLDIWYERGRLQLVNETLVAIETPVAENRQLADNFELAHDQAKCRVLSLGEALYNVYDNLAESLAGNESIHSSGHNALRTMEVVEEVFTAMEAG